MLARTLSEFWQQAPSNGKQINTLICVKLWSGALPPNLQQQNQAQANDQGGWLKLVSKCTAKVAFSKWSGVGSLTWPVSKGRIGRPRIVVRVHTNNAAWQSRNYDGELSSLSISGALVNISCQNSSMNSTAANRYLCVLQCDYYYQEGSESVDFQACGCDKETTLITCSQRWRKYR